jgi:hypothetical protein
MVLLYVGSLRADWHCVLVVSTFFYVSLSSLGGWCLVLLFFGSGMCSPFLSSPTLTVVGVQGPQQLEGSGVRCWDISTHEVMKPLGLFGIWDRQLLRIN